MFRSFVVRLVLSTTLYAGAAQATTLGQLYDNAPAVDLFPDTLVPAIDLGGGDGSNDAMTGWLMVGGGVAALAAGVFMVAISLPYAGSGGDLLWIVGALALGMTVMGALVAVGGLVLVWMGVSRLSAQPQVATIEGAPPRDARGIDSRPLDAMAARDRADGGRFGQVVLAAPVWRF